MSTSYSPNIVTNGLVLYLDAANSKSIVSGSNTWRDLSGNNTNASLVNGVGYSSANKGSLTFDGVDDHASFTRPTDFATSSFSIVVWVKFTSKVWSSNYNDLQIVIDNNHSCNPNKGFVIQDRPDFTAAKGYCPLTFGKLSDVSECVVGASSSFAVGDGKWHCVVGTADINYSYLYVDGVYQGRDFNSGSLPQTTITLGKWQVGGRYLNGQMGLVQLYNRTLSSQEVLQNYNSTKGRYGL